ncbi:MAG TPA: fructosamine kinase family protein [Steroidobacteraceae bacterium]
MPALAVIPPGAITSGRCATPTGAVFMKAVTPQHAWVLEAEMVGLAALAAAQAVRVPRVLGFDADQDGARLALEWIDCAPQTPRSEALLGEQLAMQHRVLAPSFGWQQNNTIGRCLQLNEPSGDWVRFVRERRLRPQLELAVQAGLGGALAARGGQLLEIIDALFATYRPVPSLLHGDLWSGNRLSDASGRPVIFDPAVYFGDREADIAMTRLFGGFSSAFYAAYVASWPLDPAHGTRCTLYNLYHVLNHANLFGAGYAAQAQGMIDRLLAELGH